MLFGQSAGCDCPAGLLFLSSPLIPAHVSFCVFFHGSSSFLSLVFSFPSCAQFNSGAAGVYSTPLVESGSYRSFYRLSDSYSVGQSVIGMLHCDAAACPMVWLLLFLRV